MSNDAPLSIAHLGGLATLVLNSRVTPATEQFLDALEALDKYLPPASILDLCAIVDAARTNEDALVTYQRAKTEKRGVDDALDRLRVSRFTLRLALRKVAP